MTANTTPKFKLSLMSVKTPEGHHDPFDSTRDRLGHRVAEEEEGLLPSRGMLTTASEVSPEKLRCQGETTLRRDRLHPGQVRKPCCRRGGRLLPRRGSLRPRSTSDQGKNAAACSTPAEGQIRASCRRRQGGRFATQQRLANNRVRSCQQETRGTRSTRGGTGQGTVSPPWRKVRNPQEACKEAVFEVRR